MFLEECVCPDLAVCFSQNVFALIDLYGRVESVAITSSAFSDAFNCSQPPSIVTSVSVGCIEVGHILKRTQCCHPSVTLTRLCLSTPPLSLPATYPRFIFPSRSTAPSPKLTWAEQWTINTPYTTQWNSVPHPAVYHQHQQTPSHADPPHNEALAHSIPTDPSMCLRLNICIDCLMKSSSIIWDHQYGCSFSFSVSLCLSLHQHSIWVFSLWSFWILVSLSLLIWYVNSGSYLFLLLLSTPN